MLDLSISDRVLVYALLGCVAQALLLPKTLPDASNPSVGAIFDGFGLNLGEILFLVGASTSISRLPNDASLGNLDLLVIIIASAALAVPATPLSIVIVTIVALYFIRSPFPALTSFAQLLLTLTIFEQWGRLAFNLIAPPILTGETSIAHYFLSWFGTYAQKGNLLTAANGFSVYIETDCSAFHNLSLSTLIWLSVVKYQTDCFQRRHFYALVLIYGATVATNTVRIMLAARSQGAYEYWHNGPGVSIVAVLLGVATLGCLCGFRAKVVQRAVA